jgi:hypothetical protein
MHKEEEILAVTEGFKQRGGFWRAISLVQIPIALCLIFYFVAKYLGADTIVHVKDIRGLEDIGKGEIPDKEYVNVAQNIVNLIGTYQPVNARDQFETAREFMLDSAVVTFDELQTQQELMTAEESDISQILFIDNHVVTRKSDGSVRVCLYGMRQKVVDRQALPAQDVTYCMLLNQDEPFEGNTFGLMVSEFTQRLGPQPRAAIPKKITPKFEKPKEVKKKRSLKTRKSKKPSG